MNTYNIYNIRKAIDRFNFTRANLGHIFINDITNMSTDDIKDRELQIMAKINSFDEKQEVYFPFDVVTCVAISNPNNNFTTKLSMGAITFIDNPEHKLSSQIKFICGFSTIPTTSIGYISVNQFTKGIPLTRDTLNEFVNSFRYLYPDDYVIGLPLSEFDNLDNLRYVMIVRFERIINKPTKNKTVCFRTNTINPIKHIHPSILDGLSRLLIYGYSYFFDMIVDPSKFVVEERPSTNNKRGEKVPNEKVPPLFHIIDIKTLRVKYIKPDDDDKVVVEKQSKQKKAPHERRQHIRVLRADRYGDNKGKRVLVKATWIGKTADYNPSNDRFYKVRLDHR